MEYIEIDFDVLETNNPKKLMIADTSKNWLHADELPAYIRITLPGSKNSKDYTFDKRGIMVFNSNTLGLTDLRSNCGQSEYANLPDGVYKLKLQSGFEEHFVEKYYLKTDLVEKEIAKKIVENSLNISTNSDVFIDKVFKIEWKMRVAKSFLREGNVPMVMRYYNEAVDIFKTL